MNREQAIKVGDIVSYRNDHYEVIELVNPQYTLTNDNGDTQYARPSQLKKLKELIV